MGEILSVDVLSSGCHKEQALRPLLLPHGVGTRWLEVSCDLPEIETVSPRGVLPDKLATLCKAAENIIQWRAEVLGSCPHAVLGLDVLGLQVDQPRSSFGDARQVYKKPDGGDPIWNAAEHFEEMQNTQPLVDGYYWSATVPGSAVAPVDRRTGRVLLDRTRTLWDQALYFGISSGLIKIVSCAASIEQCIRAGLLHSDSFTNKSIGGFKEELLMTGVIPLAMAQPDDGISMEFRYRKKRWVLDSATDKEAAKEITTLATAIGANASPALAGQLARTMYAMLL